MKIVNIRGSLLEICKACNPVGTDIMSSTPVMTMKRVNQPDLKLVQFTCTQNSRIIIQEIPANTVVTIAASSHLKVNRMM